MLNKYKYNGIIFFNKAFPSRKITIGEEIFEGVFKVIGDSKLKIIYENNLINNWVMIQPSYEAILIDSDELPIENNMILLLSSHSNKRNHNIVSINFISNKIIYHRDASNMNDLFIPKKEEDNNIKFIMYSYLFQSQKYILKTIYKKLVCIGYGCKILNNYKLYNRNRDKEELLGDINLFSDLYKETLKIRYGLNTIWDVFNFISDNQNIQSIDGYEIETLRHRFDLERIYKESGNKISEALICKIKELISYFVYFTSNRLKPWMFDDNNLLYDTFIYYGQDLKKYSKCNNILLVHISEDICIGLVFINKPKEKFEYVNTIQEALDSNAVSKEEVESMLSLIS